jgi:hypothetical protein
MPAATDSLRICNTYCCSAVTVVAQTCHSLTLYVLCLSCFCRCGGGGGCGFSSSSSSVVVKSALFNKGCWMSMELWQNGERMGETEVFRVKPVSVPLCLSQMLHGLALD